MKTGKSKLILFSLLALVVGLLVFSISGSIRHRGQTKVNIHVIPEDSIVKINGVDSRKNAYLKSGLYQVEASKPGWKTDTQTIEIKQDEPDKDVYLVPAPDSPESLAWLKDNPKIQQERETLGSMNFENDSNQVASKYPLVGELPYIDRYFRIDYGEAIKSQDKVTPVAIFVRALSPENRQMALNWIKQQGFDPKDYEIIFKSFDNPFASGD